MIAYSTFGTAAYLITALLEMPRCEELNRKNGLHEICGTLGPLWLPLENVTTAIWLVINFLHVSEVLIIFYSTVAVLFLIYNATVLILAHVDNCTGLFLSIFEEIDTEKKSEKLLKFINDHKHILRMSDRLNHLTKITQGHFIATSALCIGCIGNQIVTEKSIRSFMLLMGYAVGLFSLCHSGQIMMDKTESMQQLIFSAKWYLCEQSMKKDIKFILARCKTPIFFGLPPFGIINYGLFLMIMKTSYSYLTLLNQKT